MTKSPSLFSKKLKTTVENLSHEKFNGKMEMFYFLLLHCPLANFHCGAFVCFYRAFKMSHLILFNLFFKWVEKISNYKHYAGNVWLQANGEWNPFFWSIFSFPSFFWVDWNSNFFIHPQLNENKEYSNIKSSKVFSLFFLFIIVM